MEVAIRGVTISDVGLGKITLANYAGLDEAELQSRQGVSRWL